MKRRAAQEDGGVVSRSLGGEGERGAAASHIPDLQGDDHRFSEPRGVERRSVREFSLQPRQRRVRVSQGHGRIQSGSGQGGLVR